MGNKATCVKIRTLVTWSEKGAISRRVSRKRLNVPLTEIFLDRYRIRSLSFLIKLLRGLFISKNNSKKSLESDTWKRK